MNTTTKETIKNAFLGIEAGAEMTSSVKISENRYATINSDTLDELYRSLGSAIYELKKECPGNRSEFVVKYNIVSKNGPVLVTFWAYIYPVAFEKSVKVSENPGKTPQDIVKDLIFGPNSEAFGKSWIRDYFSTPVATKRYHLNSFPSCAGLADIDNRPKKEPLVINVLGRSFEIGGDE